MATKSAKKPDRDVKVESFECHETAAEPIEATEEAVAILESLGLKGQKELLSTDKHEVVRRCPYRQMTIDERFVYKVLCPREYTLADYKNSPIPLRVLQIAAHAHGTGLFDRLMVWDKGTAAEKDPVLIGVEKDKKETWRENFYILARWGEELEAFVVMLKRALDGKRQSLKDQAKSAFVKAKGEVENVANMTDEDIMRHGPTSSIYFHGVA